MYRRGDLAGAWVEIQRAAELTPSDPILWEHYGDIASALGLKDEARKGYRKSLELKSDNPGVQEKLESL
jgi:Flp pilus assembly protein TadD